MEERKLVARDVVFIQQNKYTNVMSITLTNRLRYNSDGMPRAEFVLKQGDSVTIELYDDHTIKIVPISGDLPVLPNGGSS